MFFQYWNDMLNDWNEKMETKTSDLVIFNNNVVNIGRYSEYRLIKIVVITNSNGLILVCY